MFDHQELQFAYGILSAFLLVITGLLVYVYARWKTAEYRLNLLRTPSPLLSGQDQWIQAEDEDHRAYSERLAVAVKDGKLGVENAFNRIRAATPSEKKPEGDPPPPDRITRGFHASAIDGILDRCKQEAASTARDLAETPLAERQAALVELQKTKPVFAARVLHEYFLLEPSKEQPDGSHPGPHQTQEEATGDTEAQEEKEATRH